MEIISFVQDTPRRRAIRFPMPKKKQKVKIQPNVIFSPTTFVPNSSRYNTQKVHNTFTVRTFFYGIGHFVSFVQKEIRNNLKTIFIFLAASFLICTALTFGYRTNMYIKNHTGPVKLAVSDDSDFETLNQLMNSFALENTAIEYDETGLIPDALSVHTNYKMPVSYQKYTVKSGDTISGIAKKFGLTNISTLISVNDIGNVRQLAAGQKLKIPSYDGIIYTVKKGDTLDTIVKDKDVSLKALLDVNELSSEVLTVGQQLFLPGASLDSKTLKTAMGDKFIMPISAKFRWSSPYGARIDPIAGVKSFHTGTDMACPTGTPILASMSGKILQTGENRVWGNYVIIDHGNGYQTLYAHMSKIIAVKGKWVSQGTRIGLVGSTGYSTGPHLHFTVYKNGKMIDPMTILK